MPHLLLFRLLADLTNPNVAPNNGFVIFDTSEVQARLPNPQIKVVSEFLFKDGSVAQHTIPVSIRGKSYIIHVDEGGSRWASRWVGGPRAAAGLPALADGAYRRHQRREEAEACLASLRLEMQRRRRIAPAVLPDLVGLSIFTYGTHYCSKSTIARTMRRLWCARHVQLGYPRFRHPQSAAAEGDCLLTILPAVTTAEWRLQSRTRQQLRSGWPDWRNGAGPPRCRARDAVDHLPGQWAADAEV